MHGNGLKATFTLMFTAISIYMQNIVIPITLLIALMVLDYATGMANAWIKKELSSQRGINGIIKKVSYFVVIVVAMAADYLIGLLASAIGLQVPPAMQIIGLLVVIWLAINESISILENLAKLGTPMPAFLKKLMERLKEKIEEGGDNNGV